MGAPGNPVLPAVSTYLNAALLASRSVGLKMAARRRVMNAFASSVRSRVAKSRPDG